MNATPRRVREQVMVYLTPGDRELLERMVEETGLSRTEILRRGLRSMAEGILDEREAGSAFQYLLASAGDAAVPVDLSERSDHYLYGGGYAAWVPGSEGSDREAPDPTAG